MLTGNLWISALIKHIFSAWMLILFILCAPAWALPPLEDPEESDFPPGLLGHYRAGATQLERIDPEVAFDWGSRTPDERLETGPFEVDWTGLFLVKGAGNYKFHAYVQGKVELLLDGKVVLSGSRKQAGWLSGEEVALSFGEKEIEVRFEKTAPEATIKLFWSSDQFALEPISTYLLYREEGEPELALLEQGRIEFHAHRCDRCHVNEPAHPSPSAPDLSRAGSGLSASWMIQKLTQPASPHEQMPELGLSADQAEDIVAYLQSASLKPTSLAKIKSSKPAEDRKQGELLVRSTGCLACHVVGEFGNSGPFGGGELTQIGDKRTAEWLQQWLKKPESLNAHHRMPVFTLTSNESRQMALYLADLKTPAGREETVTASLKEDSVVSKSPDNKSAQKSTTEQIERGKTLITELNCAACHQIPGIEQTAKFTPLTAAANSETASGCLNSELLQESADSQPRQHPVYRHIDQAALQAWLRVRLQEQTPAMGLPVSDFQRGRDLLTEKNCLACHNRDRSPGNVAIAGDISQADKRLTGQSQGLIPPHLTAVGDRLQDEYLRDAIAGKQPKRLPWLFVRMPKFEHSAEESDQLMTHLIGQDRLPEGIPDSRLQLAESTLEDSEELLIGRELTGGRAFNCIACHKLGDYEPRNTALGTKGSDLKGVAGRLRAPYFLRWTMSPIRIVPGMEMPSFNQPKPGFPIKQLDQQLATLWRGFNNPAFEAPSNPTVTEQYLVVLPETPARIIRDVFELKSSSQKERVFVPRPLAVGLNNGHSILFDLDSAAVRAWTYGDFAYQQTEGKSWFWYLAGAPVVTSFNQTADWALQQTPVTTDSQPGPLQWPVKTDSRRAQLIDYRAYGEGLQFTYELTFQLPPDSTSGDSTSKESVDAAPVVVTMTEIWEADQSRTQSGWRRTVQADGIPTSYQLVLTQSAATGTLGGPQILQDSPKKAISLSPKTAGELVAIPERGQATLSLTYLAQLPERSTQPFPEKPEQEQKAPQLTGTPGFQAERLPLSSNIMPTSLAWTSTGKLVFTSLKGHVYGADLSQSSGQQNVPLELIEEGLAAPFGIMAEGKDLLVVHKPEVIRLSGETWTNNSQRPRRTIVADGWGHSDNYHDWVTGFAQDANGQIYIATGSDYSQKGRPQELSRFRGDVLAIGENRQTTPIASALRYPIGIATDAQGRIFVSDQQGVQNCFNEINHIVPGQDYGVPALYGKQREEKRAAIQIPHSWTRSVNGIFFIPDQGDLGSLSAFRGHGVGCEYNNRFLVRFSFQEVEGEIQGACYELTRSIETLTPDASLLLGPICGGVGPDGHIYVGSIHDSGWLGGQNTGEIVRLKADEQLPNGFREVRAFDHGFEIEFLRPLDSAALEQKESYDLSGYTRVWQGSYATPDSGRYRPNIEKIEVLADRKVVRLHVDELKPRFVYNLHFKGIDSLFPASAYYTMNRVPQQDSALNTSEKATP